jgi:hypothetical protein
MLRLTGILGLPPAVLAPLGAAVAGLGLWQHLPVAVVVGAALLLKALLGAVQKGRS